MTTIIENEDGTVEFKNGIGFECDLCECPHCGTSNFSHKPDCPSPTRLPGCKRIATREVDHHGSPLFICEEHFQKESS